MPEDVKDAVIGGIPRYVMYALAFALFFTPADYVLPAVLDHIWDIAVIACSCYCVFLVLYRQGINLQWLFFGLFFVFFYLISGVWNQTDLPYTNIVFKLSKALGFLSLVSYGMKKDAQSCIKGFVLAGFVMCFINFVTYLVFQDIKGGMKHGMMNWKGHLEYQRWYFFSHDNGSVFYYLPVAAAAHYYAAVYRRNFFPVAWLFTIVSLYMYIDLKSMAAIVSFGLYAAMAFLIWLYQRGGKIKRMSAFSYPLMMLTGIIFNIFIIVFLNSDMLLGLLNEVFGKSSSLLERVEIWSRSIDYFAQNPILGVGPAMHDTDIARITYEHTHNILLQVAYQGGLTSLLLLLMGCVFNYRGRVMEMGNPSVAYFTASLVCIFVAGSFDFYYHYVPLFFPLFAYGCVGSSMDLKDGKTERASLESDFRKWRKSISADVKHLPFIGRRLQDDRN